MLRLIVARLSPFTARRNLMTMRGSLLKPIYFRHTTKPDYKVLSEMSEKEYPGQNVKTASILSAPPPNHFATPLDLKVPETKKKVHKVHSRSDVQKV